VSVASSALSSIAVLSRAFLDDLAEWLSNTELRIKDVVEQAAQEIEWLETRPNRFYDVIDVARVLRATYDVSFSLGENSQRYTACAIAVCHRETDEERQEMLMELGEAWITHFLFPCTPLLSHSSRFPLT
jgi:hypothetical protein